MAFDYGSVFPQSTLTNISIPKEKFYQVSDANQKIKRLFIDEVEGIKLKAVIAPRTMNIASDTYDEMHVLELQLKQSDVSREVLQTIDSVIPRPILFIIVRPSGELKYAISYKELKSEESNKSRVVQYYQTSWSPEVLKLAGNTVKSIYVGFIQQIEPNFDPSKPIQEAVLKTKEREKIQKQIDAINRKIAQEPSIARKQELARERYRLEQRLDD